MSKRPFPRYPHFASEDEVTALVYQATIGAAPALLAVIGRMLDSAKVDAETQPKLSRVFEDDVRFKLGFVKALEMVLRVPADAQAIVMQEAAESKGR